MSGDLAEFWTRIQSGIDVAVGTVDSVKLLGVRDGFLRYFHDGLVQPVPVAVSPHSGGEDPAYIPLSDEEIVERASASVVELRDRLGPSSHTFFACTETGIHSMDVDGKRLHFVRNWTAICGPPGMAYGGSGSIQLPEDLIEGLDSKDVPYAIPGTRRRGGMMSSLTGGLVNRRSAIEVSTLGAISVLLYGLLESRPLRRRRPGGAV